LCPTGQYISPQLIAVYGFEVRKGKISKAGAESHFVALQAMCLAGQATGF
jgi:hypothetical protein